MWGAEELERSAEAGQGPVEGELGALGLGWLSHLGPGRGAEGGRPSRCLDGQGGRRDPLDTGSKSTLPPRLCQNWRVAGRATGPPRAWQVGCNTSGALGALETVPGGKSKPLGQPGKSRPPGRGQAQDRCVKPSRKDAAREVCAQAWASLLAGTSGRSWSRINQAPAQGHRLPPRC